MSIGDIGENSLRQRNGEKWRRYGPNILPAWVADMDFAIAAPISAALAARIERADCGYPLAPRQSGLPELFAARVASRFDWQVEPARVAIINDVVQGIYIALQTLTAPGDGVVIQTPIYPPFLNAVKETGRRGVLCPLIAGRRRFEIDFDQLRAAVDAGTRVLLLCNPHNPTGRAFDLEELRRLAEIAIECELIVVSDEIHADLILAATAHVPMATLGAEIASRTITLMSASKAFNIAGVGLGFAHFGSAELQAQFNHMPPHTRGGFNAFSASAVAAAWSESQPWLDEVLGVLRANRDHVAQFVQRHWPDVGHFPPEATYLAWLDMRALDLPRGPYEFFLQQANVALSNGTTFGEPGRGFVRLNFATSRAILDEILERMEAALEEKRQEKGKNEETGS